MSAQQTVYFLYREGGTKAVVVDPAENGAGIFKLLSEKGFTVEAILLTHGHFDHIGGAAELKKASGAKVYALTEEKKICRTPELNLSAQMPPVVTIEADEWLTDGQMVETAGISLQVIATPGHTVGGCCYYCKEGGFLFSGDTLFEESVGRTDFPTGSMSSLVRSVKEKLFCPSGRYKSLSGTRRYYYNWKGEAVQSLLPVKR